MNMNTLKKQKGFVLVVLALLLVVLIGFLALAVDIGVLYSARTSAQEVADAAALAGAFTFINDTQSPQPQTASSNALQVALNNSVLGQPRSEEHTSELQSLAYLVCRLLLEKKNNKQGT